MEGELDTTMTQRKKTNGQTTIYKTLSICIGFSDYFPTFSDYFPTKQDVLFVGRF